MQGFMREETRRKYDTADYEEKLAIAFYVHDGWDYYWPWPDMPRWLQPRYLWPEEKGEDK